MKRLLESDTAHVDEALAQIAAVVEEIRAVDLRSYAGDDELRGDVKEAVRCLKNAQKALRHVKTLKWSRA